MSHFCIVLADQPHRLVFAELVESLSWGLSELAHDVEVSTYPRAGARNIILAPHLLLASDENVKLEPGTIVYNGEPHFSHLFGRSLRLLGLPHVEPWDYSRESSLFLAALGIPVKTVPYAWCPSLTRPRARAERDIDVLFVGSHSPRRDRIVQKLDFETVGAELERAKLNHSWIYGCYGPERDGWLLRSKVLLNVHYWPEGGSEDLRILLGAANNVAVVAEGLPDEPYKEDWAEWVPYSEVAAACVRQVEGDRWKQTAARAFAAVQMQDAAMVLKEALR